MSQSLGQLDPDLLRRKAKRFCWVLLTILRATRSWMSFKVFPISILTLRIRSRIIPTTAKSCLLDKYDQASFRILVDSVLVFKGRLNGFTVARYSSPSRPRLPTDEALSTKRLPSTHPIASLNSEAPFSPFPAAPSNYYSAICLLPPHFSSTLPLPIPAQLL